MEPFGNKVRLKLVIGKFPVLRAERSGAGFQVAIDMLNGVKLIFSGPFTADVREGDLLTLYTEVLTDAKSEPTSIQ